MLDFAKKALAFALGMAALTTDKAKQLVEEAVARGELTKEDAKKFFDEVATAAEKEKQGAQTWIREQIRKAVHEGGVTEEDRVALLEARIAALEQALAEKKASTKSRSGTGG